MDAAKVSAFQKHVESNPASLCVCGHTGNGGNSQHHTGGFQSGHGACMVDGCKCKQFTWDRWTEDTYKILRGDKANGQN